MYAPDFQQAIYRKFITADLTTKRMVHKMDQILFLDVYTKFSEL